MMPKTKKQLKFFSFYDFPAIEKHLTNMAAEGWMIKSAEGNLWKYEQIEPKRLHFAVTYFPKAHALDPEPSEELKMLWDFCEHTGWKLAVQAAQIQIFYNEAENPRPIETDPVTQLENIHRAAKKSVLTNLWAGLFLGLLNLGLFFAQLFTQPVDTLANPLRLWSCVIWMLYLVSILSEPISYFRWYRKARVIAQEEDRLAFPRNSRLRNNIIFLLITMALIWLLLYLSTSIVIHAFIFTAVYGSLIFVLVRGIMRFLKRRKVSAKANISITMIVSMVLAFALVGPLTLALIGATERGWISDDNAAGTYEHDGRVWEYYEDELPLTVEDLTGEQYEGYSRQLATENTMFLAKVEGRQRARFDAENFKTLPDLEYTVTQVKLPLAYELCKKDILNDRDDRKDDHIPEGHKNIYESRDPSPWGAVEVYQLTAQDSGPMGFWVLCYESHIVEIVFYGWDPSLEQMAIVAEKLGNTPQ